MSIRAGGDPLVEVVPELEHLLTDPRQYLTEGPLLFGPRRYFGLAALFGLPGIVLLILWGFAPAETDRLALGIAMLVGASIWLFYSLGSAGHSIFLGPNGVEIRYRDSTVFCPWDLFDVDDEVWTPAGQESPTAGVTVPIAPEAVPLVVWRRGVVELGRGLKIRAPQAWLLSPHELVLPGRYELRSEDLGKLLLLLGMRLGGRIAAGDLRTTEAIQSESAPDLPEPDRDGFYTVSLTRFRLPPCCCVCAGEPERTLTLMATSGVLPWFGAGPLMWTPAGQSVPVEVPICQRCFDQIQASYGTAVLRWTGLFALIGLVGGLLAPGDMRGVGLAIGVAIGSLVGLIIGSLVGVPQPIDLRNYHPPTGTLRVRFRNPEVEKRYREWRARH